ncbi:uncharacterized protein LOC141713593 isoform X3 [Apium graveolens]|uniref:uncharacterized protein LOC141713593 isoform X3 n=1 Tax=Apium graveolens TaxID=4045 RepID=UPI003D7924AA
MEDSDCFSLIDENDSLISPDADDNASLTHLHSVGDIGGYRVDGMDSSSKCDEQLPQLSETAEPEIPRKTGKLNLRKSLAWDRAFFESPGFLDAEEISTIIDGADKGKKHFLPGIDEDISRSTESISTLASENLALDSLEDELFKDIRASIQKSSISTSNRKAAPKETDKLVKSVKVDITPNNGSARNVTSKRPTGGMQGPGRILKKDSTSALAMQPGLRNGNSSSSFPRPPKIISKPEAMPGVTAKRALSGANHIKTENNNSKGKGVQAHVPVAAGLAGPRKSVPRPASFPKALGSASSGATIKEVGRSPCSSTGSKSTSIEKIQKSTLASARTKATSRPVIQASSKIPLSKKPPGKSGLPSSFTSSKNSESISPSSSISEWSSASSSTSTVNQKLTSRSAIDTNSSCRSMEIETPSILCHDVQSNDGISNRILNQFKESPCQDVKKTNAENNVLSRSALMKPSGLRMPSPKIGFFDGQAKSVVHTPNAHRQSQLHLPTGLPKIRSSKKAEGNIPSGKKAISSANTVLITSKSTSPRPSQESSRTSIKGDGDLKRVLSPNVSSEVRSSNKGTGMPWPEITLTSTQIELEGQKSDSPKSFQENASPGISLEQSQSYLPTDLPKIRAAVHSPFGSSKKTKGKILAGKKATSGANTVLDTLKFAAPKSSPESSRASIKGHSNHRNVLSPDISTKVRSSIEGSGKPWSKMTFESTKTELQGQNSGSVKSFQESAFVGLSPEKSQSCLPTISPEIEASVCDLTGHSKKEGNIPAGEKATAVAITVLDTLQSASPTPSQESSRVLMKCHDDTESVVSPNISSETRSSNKGTGKPWPEMTLTSTNIELEHQKSESPKPIQEIACPGVSQEQSHLQSPTSLPKIGAAVHSPIGSSKKVEGNTPARKNTSGANTVLNTSESAVPEPSSLDSMKGHGDHRSFLSPDISSELISSDEVTRKPCSELSLTSTNIELEDKKSDSPKPNQEIACLCVSQEQHHSQSPTSLPKIGAAARSSIGSSKKVEGNTPAGKNTSGANTVLDTSESAAPEPSQESSMDSMKGPDDHRSLLSPDIYYEVTSADEVTRKPCSELTLTSTNTELEDKKSESPKPIQESARPGVSQEQSHSQSPTSLPKIGAAAHSPIGSSKKVDGNTQAGKNTSAAITVLDMSESAAPEQFQESSVDSIKGLGDNRSLLSPDISYEVTSSDEVTRNPCSELSLTSTNIELEDKKSDSPKPNQEIACLCVSQEQYHSQSPNSLPKIGAAARSSIGSSKKVEGNTPAGKNTSGANTVLDTSESAAPEPSQESSMDSTKGHDDHRSLLSPDIYYEVTSADEVTRKPCSELTLTSTNTELEDKKSESPKPIQESARPGVSQEQSHSQSPTSLPKIGAAAHSPIGSSKKVDGNTQAGKNTSAAITVLDMSESAAPEQFQESSVDSIKGLGDYRSLLSPDISSELISSDEVTRKPCSELSLTCTNIELEDKKPDSPKPNQESSCPGVSQEQYHSQSPTSLPKFVSAARSSIGSSKKVGRNTPAGKNTSGANTVPDTSESAAPELSQESSMDSMKGLDNHRSFLSADISYEVTSSDEVTRKPCSELTLTSTNFELEDKKSESPRPIQESARPSVSQEQSHSQSPTSLPKIGAAAHSPTGSSKKVDGNTQAGKNTSAASTVLDMSDSAAPEQFQESSVDSMKGLGDHMSLLSPDISSEVISSDEVTRKPCSELSLTSTNIELEDENFDSPKQCQDSACPGVSQEQSQSQLPTSLPTTRTVIHSPVGSSKKAEGFISSVKKTSGANTVLYMSESATPEPSLELRHSMKSNGDHRILLSPYIFSEVTSSAEVIKKPCSELSLTSTNIELEGQKSDSAKPFQETASFGLAPEHQSCLPTGFPKIEAAICSPVGSLKKEGKTHAGGKATAGTNIMLDTSKKSDYAKPFQETASFGLAPEHQSCLPTGFPKIEAAICSPVGSLKKEGKTHAGGKATAGTNIALDTSKSASAKPSQDSPMASTEGHRDFWKLSPTPTISSEVLSSNMRSGNPCSEITYTSTDIELEGQISDFPRPFQECTNPVASPDVLSEIDISNCVKAGDVKIGKRESGEQAPANVSEAENNEDLLLNI